MWEMHAFHQGVGDGNQVARGRWHQHRAVVADADAHITAFGAEPREVLPDEFEFGLGHVAPRSLNPD